MITFVAKILLLSIPFINSMMISRPQIRSSVSALTRLMSVAYDGKSSLVNKLNPNKTAVLLIEYQNEFTTAGGKLHEAVKPCMEQTSMLSNSIELVQKAREKGIKIFHAAISFTDNYREISSPYGILGNVKGGSCFVKESWGSEFIDSMKPHKDDIIVDGKRGLCSFGSTNLDFLLRHNGIENLILAGFLTNCCVESTMRTGYEKGYKGMNYEQLHYFKTYLKLIYNLSLAKS